MFPNWNWIALISIILITFEIAYADYPNFYLYTRSKQYDGKEVDEANLKSSTFSPTRKTYLIVHGFNGAADSEWVMKLKTNLLQAEDSNVIAVDWSEGASGIDYFDIANLVNPVGTKISNFLSKSSINPSNVHCIGHSLGAHVCGFTGKATKLARITGLDPAGPAFKDNAPSERLDKTDATFVDVIHGDHLLGIQDPIGHKDFYPNGGEVQAGCPALGKRSSIDLLSMDTNTDSPLISALSCSHTRVIHLYAESIISKCKFTSVPCDNNDNFKTGNCKCNSSSGCSTLGHYSIKNKEEGKFYLETNSEEPFCMN